jgi:ABC-type phosphate transport system substrate-binding protein
MHVVKLKFRQISEEGFFVTLTQDRDRVEIEGFLSFVPDRLQLALQQWQSIYRSLNRSRSLLSLEAEFRILPRSSQNVSYWEYTNLVKLQLNSWLNSKNPEWQAIREGLIAIANQLHQENDREVQIIIDTQNIELRRLPWQEWDLVEKYYPHSEIAFTSLKLNQVPVKKNTFHLDDDKVKILVVVGKSEGINTKSDLEVIRQLEEKGATVTCLLQPSLKDFCEALWQECGYDIFIFTGHSSSQEDGQIGWIEINDRENIAIAQFKDAFKQAIDRGLQLAIFNSCDGLGLANQLADLNLPQSIVMREPIPDEVAIEFLKYLFQEFTNHKSLLASIHTAKKRLESFQSRYPGIVWLPVLCLKPSVDFLYWQKIRQPSQLQPKDPKPPKTSIAIKRIGVILITSILSFSLGFGIPLVLPLLSATNSTSSYSTIASINNIPAGIWQYGGSITWEPIRQLVDRQIIKEHPEFKLLYTPHPSLPPGSGTGIKMLLEGQLSFVQSSRPLEDKEYKMALQRGIMLKQVPVAIDSIAFAVNPELNIKGLNLRQIRDIYTGKITNWNQIGGDDLNILPYARPLESGTTEFFQENILDRKKFSDRVIFVENNKSAIEQLSNLTNLGAIYFASATEIVGECKLKPVPISRYSKTVFTAPYESELIQTDKCARQENFSAFQNGDYPLTRRLFAIVTQNGQLDERVGEAYANLLFTDEGQKLIKKAGFLPMRAF